VKQAKVKPTIKKTTQNTLEIPSQRLIIKKLAMTKPTTNKAFSTKKGTMPKL